MFIRHKLYQVNNISKIYNKDIFLTVLMFYSFKSIYRFFFNRKQKPLRVIIFSKWVN
jgi:hypothetical protein